jgi:hypothetical protein
MEKKSTFEDTKKNILGFLKFSASELREIAKTFAGEFKIFIDEAREDYRDMRKKQQET